MLYAPSSYPISAPNHALVFTSHHHKHQTYSLSAEDTALHTCGRHKGQLPHVFLSYLTAASSAS